jgi:hypothetical protein
MLLMPRSLVARSFKDVEIDDVTVTFAADKLSVGVSALVEHLYNTSMIDETTRDSLREGLSRA